ncbi:MAG: cyclic nucleotide-binding domain-containing protein [Myxococcales bacterium]
MCKLFAHLSPEELASLDGIVQESFEEKGTVLAQTGQLMESFGVLASGKVDVEGVGKVDGVHERGWSFGAESVLTVAPSPVRVVVLEDCLLLKVARSDLMALMRREPGLAVKLLFAVVQETTDQLQELRGLVTRPQR